MNQVDHILLVCENVETIRFETFEIGRFFVDDIITSISRVGGYHIMKEPRCGTLFMELLPCANHTYNSFVEGMTTFERLQEHKDIVAVDITYQDGSADHVCVPWSGNSNETNEAQMNYLAKSGSLYVLIRKDGSSADYIDYEEMDNQDPMSLDRWYL